VSSYSDIDEYSDVDENMLCFKVRIDHMGTLVIWSYGAVHRIPAHPCSHLLIPASMCFMGGKLTWPYGLDQCIAWENVISSYY